MPAREKKWGPLQTLFFCFSAESVSSTPASKKQSSTTSDQQAQRDQQPQLSPYNINSIDTVITDTQNTPAMVVVPPSVGQSLSLSRKDATAKNPFLIAVAGGEASGKAEACLKIVEKLVEREQTKVVIINMSSFFISKSGTDGDYHYDHPDTIEWKLFEQCLRSLSEGSSIELPGWDYLTSQRTSVRTTISKPDIVIIEGTLALYKKALREAFDLKVFVDVDSDVRLARHVVRDTEVRKKPIDVVLADYVKHVKPTFDDFIFPTKKFADVIIPRGAENVIALELLGKHIHDILDDTRDDVSVAFALQSRSSLEQLSGSSDFVPMPS